MSVPDLNRIIGKIEDLPTLPRTVLKITELVNNPRSSAKDLARIITDDQVLTARLLKLVNSSFYGFPQRISTVTGAIVLLGFDAIRNLLLTTSVFDIFAIERWQRSDKIDQRHCLNRISSRKNLQRAIFQLVGESDKPLTYRSEFDLLGRVYSPCQL